jgi:hypothetical protein
MKKDKKSITDRLKRIYKLTKKGLFWHGVRNNLAKLGIDFMPYYWSKSTFTNFEIPKVGLNQDDLILSFFGEEEIKFIKSSVRGIDVEGKDFIKYLKSGERCLGLKYKNEIVAYVFIRLDSFYFRKRLCELGDNESYIHSLYVFDKFRGNNIAPFLRYKYFEILYEEGIKDHYGITEYFNKASLKFQRKLNPINHKSLILSIILFNTWYKNITIKNFK